MKILMLLLIIILAYKKSFSQFEPDTSINKKVYLLNSKSIKKEFGDLMSSLNKNESLPDIYFSSKNNHEYLRLIFHPGDFKNSFAMFEVGYISPKIRVNNILKYEKFYTEHNIRLGMSRKSFLNIMKNHVKKMKVEDSYILRLENANNPFLEMYGLPVYEAKYTFKNNLLINFYFGFEYP